MGPPRRPAPCRRPALRLSTLPRRLSPPRRPTPPPIPPSLTHSLSQRSRKIPGAGLAGSFCSVACGDGHRVMLRRRSALHEFPRTVTEDLLASHMRFTDQLTSGNDRESVSVILRTVDISGYNRDLGEKRVNFVLSVWLKLFSGS